MKTIKAFLQSISLVVISAVLTNQLSAQTWTEDANYIWNTISGKNVGIGTSAPETKLHITDGNQSIKFLTGTNSSGYGLSIGANDDGINFSNNSTVRGYNFNNASGNLFNITSSGNVGIGTTNPIEKLDVRGNVFINSNIDDNHIYWEGHYMTLGTPAGSYTHNVLKLKPGGSSSGTLYAGLEMYTANSTTSFDKMVQISTSGNTYFNGGNVGIGTDNPQAKLDINGAIRVSGQAIYFLGDSNDPNYLIQSGDWKDGMKYKHWTSHQFFTNGIERLRIAWNGNVGIGITNPTEKLTVNGNIKAKKIIATQSGWADYVFDKDYKLMSLNDLSAYVQQHKHLPEIPTTKQIEKEGVDVGTNQALLLKKIEELTLYIIEQHKQLTDQNQKMLEQQKQIVNQNQQMQVLTQTVEELKTRIKTN